MSRKGYGPYRGRSKFQKFLRTLLLALALAVALLVGALIFLQHYLVFSDDGVRLELPFLPREEQSTPTPPPPTPTVPIVVVTPEPVIPAHLQAVLLPREALTDGTAATQAAEAGANALIFDMKANDGTLGYVSGVPLAIEARASAADPALNDAIRALGAQEGVYMVARVSCFKDHLLSNADRTLNITTNSGYRWTDPEDLRWSSPTSETVRQYIADLCAELAGLGFDEILLDYAGYPTEGNLGYIRKGAAYDKAAFETIIGGFYTQVAAALSDHPEVKLSIVTDMTALQDGVNPLSGQSVQNLLGAADRVWVRPGESSYDEVAAILEHAGMQEVETGLVFIAARAGRLTQSWAIFPGG